MDFGVGLFEPVPEGFSGVGVFALADKDDGTAHEIEDDGEVAMAVADGDFIDGDVLEMFEFGLAESRFQVAFEQVFDGVPTDPKMLGDGLDGHVGEQMNRILFE